VAQSGESMFVRTKNSEIQHLISIHMDGNQALNFAIFHPYENSVNFRPYGGKK